MVAGGSKMEQNEQAKQKKREYNRDYGRRTGYAAQTKYQKERSTAVTFRIFSPQEDDIAQWLQQQPNKSGYIKALIRADMAK
jgi:hypothetical protein